jgi:hypothetical protein
MKLTDSEIIKSGERELIDTIIGDLDWDAIEKIFKDRHQLQIRDDVEYRCGDLVVNNGQVAYHLEFDVKVRLSILLDRSGNYLSLAVQSAAPEEDPGEKDSASMTDSDLELEQADIGSSVDPCKPATENISHMADQIAEMLSEINDD